MKIDFCNVRGIETRYLFEAPPSGGRPLLLIHGFGWSGDAWFRNIDELAGRRPVFAPDMVGHGMTATADTGGEPLPSAAVSHLLDWIDLMGWRELDIVGSSFGALIAARLYLERANLVKRLIIVGSGMCFAPEDKLALELSAVERERSDFSRASFDQWKAYLNRWMGDAAPIELITGLLTYNSIPGKHDYLFSAMSHMRDMDTLRPYRIIDKLENLRVPTLVIWGENDEASVVHAAEAVERMPSAELVVFDECGHLPYLEDAGRFNKIVDDFLSATAI